jgi:hypothetical protein
MRLIDRIALNRVIKLILDFILAVLKIFAKDKQGNKPVVPVHPKPRKRPLKDLVDNVLPWRKK